jgi:hypothetical protein
MTNTLHIEWLLEGTESWNKRRKSKDFRPIFTNAGIHKAFSNFRNSNTTGRAAVMTAGLMGANLNTVNLSNADLRQADLTMANLREADLRSADARFANLNNANLIRANLSGADLREADLKQADLKWAGLKDTDLRSFYMKPADNENAVIKRTDLRKTLNLSSNQLKLALGTKGPNGTLLPDGLEAPEHWDNDPMVFDAAGNIIAPSTKIRKMPTTAIKKPPTSSPQKRTISPNEALNTPLVLASQFDIEINENSIEARPNPEEIFFEGLKGNSKCSDAIETLRFIVNDLIEDAENNHLGNVESDLAKYVSQISKDEISFGNLDYIIGKVRAASNDPYTVEAWDDRTIKAISSFLKVHDSYVKTCRPSVADSQKIKVESNVSDAATVSILSETTSALKVLTENIEFENATGENLVDIVQMLVEGSDRATAANSVAFGPEATTRAKELLRSETVEAAALTSRLYWRVQEEIAKRPAEALTLSTAPIWADKLVAFSTQLQPIYQKFTALIPSLPIG